MVFKHTWSATIKTTHLPLQLLKRHSATPATDGKPLRLSSVMSINGSTPNDVVREIAVLKKLDHPNIVKLREVRAIADCWWELLCVEGGCMFAPAGNLCEDCCAATSISWLTLPAAAGH